VSVNIQSTKLQVSHISPEESQ